MENLFRNIACNHYNSITFKCLDGSFSKKSYAELYGDLRILLTNENFAPTGGGQSAALIIGRPSYQWLLAAIACMYTKRTIIALPEGLSEQDIEDNLLFSDLSFDLVFADKELADSRAFTGVRTILLNTADTPVMRDPATELHSIEPENPFVDIIAFSSGTTASRTLKAFHLYGDRIMNHIGGYVRNFNLTRDDNWVVCHSFSHIVHFEYALGGLIFGYNVSLIDPIDLVLRGKQFNPSALVTVPGIYEQIYEQIRRKIRTDNKKMTLLAEAENDTYTEQNLRKWVNVLQQECAECKEYLGGKLKVMIIGAAPSRLNLKKMFQFLGYPIFEGYGMTEIGMISCNVPGAEKLGTVGIAFEGISLNLADDNVLLVKSEFRCADKYLHEQANSDTFIGNGWINTGDFASIDHEKFVTIEGRKKEVIISDRGKNIIPERIEERIAEIGGVEHCLVYGDNKPYLIALVFVKTLETFDQGYLESALTKINETLPQHEKVIDFLLLRNELSEENQMITRSHKIRRKMVYGRYQEEIEGLYQMVK
ncbi:AMP-binding protein [Dyadobacter beijingensis]|nr:AMP-binding protein [Dyadobacter beijingensis]